MKAALLTLLIVAQLGLYQCFSQSGICSWYDAPPGAKTANGEGFNPNGLTAAHKTLPFGTHVRVSIGGRSITVRINDRGPFVRGRILDLTPRGADELAIRQKGIAHCTIHTV